MIGSRDPSTPNLSMAIHDVHLRLILILSSRWFSSSFRRFLSLTVSAIFHDDMHVYKSGYGLPQKPS